MHYNSQKIEKYMEMRVHEAIVISLYFVLLIDVIFYFYTWIEKFKWNPLQFPFNFVSASNIVKDNVSELIIYKTLLLCVSIYT